MILSTPVNNDELRRYYLHLVEVLASYPPLEGVSLLPIDANSFQPCISTDYSAVNIGVYLPDNGQIAPASLNPQFPWDTIIVPSLWLEYQLKIRGITNVVTIPPGYVTLPPVTYHARQLDGKFIVATSGRVSLHQGHDLVLAAMKQFMTLHDDCWLACNWSLTRHDMDALRPSPYCNLEDCYPWDRTGFLERNGIDVSRLLIASTNIDSDTLSDLVSSSDMYLSPARVALGDDEVTSAFRTAGKPIIAFEPIDSQPQLAPDGTTIWFEPAISDVIARLESAYELWRAGHPVAHHDNLRSWAIAADELYQAVCRCCKKDFPVVNHPVSAFTLNKRGAALAALGLKDAAFENFRQSLALNPLNPETYNCIGNLMDTQERYQEALLYFDKSIGIDKHFAAAYFNKATTLKQIQRLDEAIEVYQKALQIDPRFVMGWLNLAIAFALNKQDGKADDCFRKTLELDPDNTDALFLWGNQLLGQLELEKAIDCYERVLNLEPDHYLACNSLGIAYLSLMEAERAYDVLQRALSIRPDMTSAMTNIGTACRDLERLEEAVFWYNHALSLEPDDADTHWNFALALLHQGNYKLGWQEYEWRFQKSDKINIRSYELPRWKGENLRGKRIILQAEQGYGDTIQFMRYAQVIASQGADVIVECQDLNIQSVVKLLPNVADVITWNDLQPPADLTIPLLSIPFIVKTTLDTIPLATGYITPPADRVSYWNSFIGNYSASRKLRVGFVWDGRKTFRNDKRSISLDKMMPLFELENITFISLQKGDQAQQLKTLPLSYTIIDVSEQLTTFADTAALIASLDLMICVDTSVAHLAGAIGCPTWVMLKKGPDWRWLENRQDSPWYASVRLFRQSADGVWNDVVDRICHELVEFKKN